MNVLGPLRHLLEKNRRWLGCGGLSWGTRLAFYPALALAAWRDRHGGREAGCVRYLGHPFAYDNPLAPLLLLGYPDEVHGRILGNVEAPVRAVLDIGGNLGQFAVTMAALGADVAHVDVFEPNPTIFPLLERNARPDPVIRCFAAGVGPGGRAALHFNPRRTGIGSLIPENARHRVHSRLEQVDVPLVADVPAVTGRARYDLVKVDVEGFEYEVVEALAGVSFRYLFLEVTGVAKSKAHPHSRLHALLERKYGTYEVRYQSEGGATTTVFETLFEFVGPPR